MSPGHVRARRAKTLHGEIAFERSVYECPRCRQSVAPLDREMALGPHEQLTGRAVKKVAYEVADSSFPQSAKKIEHQAEICVSTAECARIAEQHGTRLDALQREREAAWVRPVGEGEGPAAPEIQAERLVVEADAAAVLTVAGEEHKMVYCATAFALEDRVTKETATARPMLARRRYTASADFEDFHGRLKALACRMGVARTMLIAFIGDGAACLWLLARDLFPRAVFIQDFWHVCEHLKELIRDLFGEGGVADALYEKWKTALWESRLDDILADLESEQKRRRGSKRERIEHEMAYLQNGRDRMDYARFRAEGWPIGSGAAEGTCKHLIKERFNVTGARWKREKIPNVLALRLSIFNEEWETDWATSQAA
jgi:hypothetical protein